MRQPVKLSDDIGTGTLHCPQCGGFNLHQGRTEVYLRNEDEPYRRVVADWMNGGKVVVVDDQQIGNPSRRRNGLRIYMECEECGPVQDLVVYQHKGTTYIEWEDEAILELQQAEGI